MKKFYAVTAGDYSDYHIVAITNDKEKAEHIKYLYDYSSRYTKARVEEYTDVMQDNLVFYSVYLYKEDKPTGIVFFNNPELGEINKVRKVSDACYNVVVKAEDEPHAIKIASDLVAQYKAQKNEIA